MKALLVVAVLASPAMAQTSPKVSVYYSPSKRIVVLDEQNHLLPKVKVIEVRGWVISQTMSAKLLSWDGVYKPSKPEQMDVEITAFQQIDEAKLQFMIDGTAPPDPTPVPAKKWTKPAASPNNPFSENPY